MKYFLVLFLGFLSFRFMNGATLTGIIALDRPCTLNEMDFSRKLKAMWGHELDTSRISGASDALAFEMGGEMVGVMSVSTPLPWSELELPCQYAFLWKDAGSEMKQHKAQIIITILTGKAQSIERQKTLTKLICVLLSLSRPRGVYLSDRMLVISPEDYRNEAKSLNENKIPLGNWVLISMATKNGKNIAFTSGLEIFGLKEFEAVYNSEQLVEAYQLLYSISNFVLEKVRVLKDGEEFSLTEEKKYKLKEEKSLLFEKKSVLTIKL